MVVEAVGEVSHGVVVEWWVSGEWVVDVVGEWVVERWVRDEVGCGVVGEW